MTEHTITVEASGFDVTEDQLLAALRHVERHQELLGPAVAGDLDRGVVTLIATVETESHSHAVAVVTATLGEALVAVGVAEQWRPAATGEAVIANVS